MSSIVDSDLEFQNSMVKVVALGNLQAIEVAETTVGPLEEGKEYEVRYWVASELVKAGYARFYEDVPLTFASLNKIHWRETKLQTGRQISPLPEFFYPKLRRYMEELRQNASRDATLAGEYAQASRLARDIINCRLNKIVNLATYPPSENVLRPLSKEERSLFDSVCSLVSEWEAKIFKAEG